MLIPYIVVAWLFVVGIYGAATSKNAIHLIGCIFVIQSSTYVLLVTVGYRRGATAPVLKDLPPSVPTVDPVVQAMTLTDIVVGAAVSALLLVFAVQAHKKKHTEDPSRQISSRG